MKKPLLWILIAFSMLMSSSTPSVYQNTSLQRELASLTERGLACRWLSNDRLEATDPLSGNRWVFNTESLLSPRKPTYDTIPTLTVDLRTIDTSLYAWKFHYINTVPLTGTWGFPLEVSDFNRNGMPEAYGWQQTQSEHSTRCYEMSVGGWMLRHIYPSESGTVDKSGDIDNNGLGEVYGRYRDSIFVLEQLAMDSLPTRTKFRHMQWYGNATGIPNQIDFMTGGLLPEIVYRGAEPVTSEEGIYVTRYDSTLNNLRRVWSIHIPAGCSGESCPWAIATGDFDGDGQKEIVTSTLPGNVYVMEHVAGDSFAVTWSTTLSVAGRAAAGDVDGNGVTEFFVGGTQAEADGYVHLRAYAFERTGDNTFQPTFAFNIFPAGIFFVDLYQTADVDGDGVPELLLSFAGGIAIFKGAGEHNYQLFYHKFVSSLDGLSAWKIGGNRAAHLFVSKFLTAQQMVSQTDVYGLDSTLIVRVEEERQFPVGPKLFQNYPNPFNAQTTIGYELSEKGHVLLRVFDINGREVKTLVDGVQGPGSHSIQWSFSRGTSGVYFLKLTVNNKTLSKKVLYLK